MAPLHSNTDVNNVLFKSCPPASLINVKLFKKKKKKGKEMVPLYKYNIGLLISVFHIGLVIASRSVVLA